MNKKISLTKLAKDPGCLSEYDPNSMDFYSAQKWISQFINPIAKRETVTIDEALGRVLLNDIKSNSNVPNYDNSAMDGYAIPDKMPQVGSNYKVIGEVSARLL